MKNKTKAWIEYAEKDLEVIGCIKSNPNLDRMIAFHGQQMTEKLLKAVLEENEILFPKIHNLTKLYDLFPEAIKTIIFIPEESLLILDSVYIDTRYPADIGLLPKGNMTNEERKKFLKIIYDIYEILESYFKS